MNERKEDIIDEVACRKTSHAPTRLTGSGTPATTPYRKKNPSNRAYVDEYATTKRSGSGRGKSTTAYEGACGSEGRLRKVEEERGSVLYSYWVGF